MKMTSTWFLIGGLSNLVSNFMIAMIVLGIASHAHAQLIGNRTVGAAPGSNQPRIGGGSPNLGANNSTSLSGRFIRGNRSRNDFVGSNRTDQQGFVGSTQAIGVGRVQSAVEGLRVPNQRSVNRPLPAQPATGPYYPKLEVDFEPQSNDEDLAKRGARSESVLVEAQKRISKITGSTVSVVRIGGLGIARGLVPDKRTADLVVTLLSFEPGIDQIKNEMQIEK